MPVTVGPVALDEIAHAVVETMLSLTKHQRTCKQCRIDDRFCTTALTYQSHIVRDLSRYERARADA